MCSAAAAVATAAPTAMARRAGYVAGTRASCRQRLPLRAGARRLIARLRCRIAVPVGFRNRFLGIVRPSYPSFNSLVDVRQAFPSGWDGEPLAVQTLAGRAPVRSVEVGILEFHVDEALNTVGKRYHERHGLAFVRFRVGLF